MVQIKNPLTIVNQGGPTPPAPAGTGDPKITAYDTTTGVITGESLGSTAGAVYLLNRDTDTWVLQPHSSWSATSITLTNPIDTSVIEGYTSIVVVRADGFWSTKWLIQGQIAVSGYGIVYRQDPDTRAVSKIALQPGAISLLSYTGGYLARKITLGADTFYSDEIIGFQFGSDFVASGTLNDGFLSYCPNLRQPIVIPSGYTGIGNYVLNSCNSFNEPILFPDTLTSIGISFMQACRAFNQPLIFPSSVATLVGDFLRNGTSFNQPLDISSVSTIGGAFLRGCTAFNQPLTLPSEGASIGNYFLYECSSFNQPLTLPSDLTTLETQFLASCRAFNRPLIIPSTVDSIKEGFMMGCYAFNQPLTIPSSVTSIGNYFLSACHSFNQPLTIPSTVTSIGSGFLSNCFSFNQPLTIPSSVTSIGGSFLNSCAGFSNLEVNTTASPTDTNSLSIANNVSKIYDKGIIVTGTGASTWITNLPDRTTNPYRKLIDGTA